MTTEGGFVPAAIPKFDGHYDHRCMLMENFMRSKQYWSVIEDGIPVIREETQPTEAQRTTLKEAKLKDMKAKNYLFQAIDRSILETMLTKDKAKDIWDSLKTKFDNNVSFEEEVVHQRLRKTLTHVLELSSYIYLDDRAWEVLNFDSAGMRL
nr:hypothetical protein [Tanacetum cinerariifolium]